MGDDYSSGTTRDTLESLKAERADLEKTVVCVQQMTRDFDTLTERRKSFDAKRVSTHLQLKGPHLRRRVWAGILSPEGFQWHKEAIARKKVLGEQLLKDFAAFCQALVASAEDLERRENDYRAKAEQQIVCDPINNVGPDGKSVEGAAGWIWNQGGLKATVGIIADAVNNLGSGTIYSLSRTSDYANDLISSDDPLEVLTQDVPMSETSKAAAKNMDPAAKAGWYNPSDPGNNAAKTLLNVATTFIDPENAGKVVSNEVRADAAAGDGVLTLKPYNEAGGHHIPAKSAIKGAPNYNPNTALAVPQSVLESLNLDHGAIIVSGLCTNWPTIDMGCDTNDRDGSSC